MKDALDLLTSDPFRVAFYCWCGAVLMVLGCAAALIVETVRGRRQSAEWEEYRNGRG